MYLIDPINGALTQTLITFLLAGSTSSPANEKAIKKSQGCIRFARKLTLIGRGQSAQEGQLFILGHETGTPYF